MDTHVLVVARRDRLPHIESRGGIAGRHTGAHTVHLVSAAATPLGGDTITVRIVVEPGARLRLRSVAATIALPGSATDASHARLDLELAGSADIDLEPTIVAATATHHSAVTATLAGRGELHLRERVQIGRSGEQQGFWSGSMRVDADDHPVLRHRVQIGAGAVTDDALSAPRACVSEMHYPGWAVRPAPGVTALDLAAGGVLTTWQGAVLPGISAAS